MGRDAHFVHHSGDGMRKRVAVSTSLFRVPILSAFVAHLTVQELRFSITSTYFFSPSLFFHSFTVLFLRSPYCLKKAVFLSSFLHLPCNGLSMSEQSGPSVPYYNLRRLMT